MGKMTLDDGTLTMEWSVRRKGPFPVENDDNKKHYSSLNQPGYEAFVHFEQCSFLGGQHDVVLSAVQAGHLKFIADIRVEASDGSWKCGWLQTIRKADRHAQYQSGRALHLRIHPLPIRDVEDPGAWPFSDTPCKLLPGTYKVKSEDSPIHYVPKVHPNDAQALLQSSSGELDFLTLLVCYKKSAKRLIVLDGFQWTLDFSGVYKYDAERNVSWTPNGTGLAIRQIAHPTQDMECDKDHPPLFSLWGAEKLSLSELCAAEQMQESFDGVGWSAHTDHTDDEGEVGVSWLAVRH